MYIIVEDYIFERGFLMRKIVILLLMVATMFAVDDGGSLRNEAGEHVELGVEDGTQNIKWIKVTTDGYSIVSLAPSASTAPTLEIDNLTAGLADADYDFGGETALSFSVLNTTAIDTLYIGLATGGPYVTIYPYMSFAVPSCALTEIWYLGTSATTTFDIIFTY